MSVCHIILITHTCRIIIHICHIIITEDGDVYVYVYVYVYV